MYIHLCYVEKIDIINLFACEIQINPETLGPLNMEQTNLDIADETMNIVLKRADRSGTLPIKSRNLFVYILSSKLTEKTT